MSKSKKKDYDVGYKKPPKSTQFKPGQSGNPKGRPKQSKNLNTLIREELSRQVILTENGQDKKMSKAEAMTKRLVNQALNGNMNAIKTLISHAGEEQSTTSLFELNEDHREVYENLISRVSSESLDIDTSPHVTEEAEDDFSDI